MEPQIRYTFRYMAKKTNSLTNSFEQLEDAVAPYFTDKAPFQIPDGAKEFLVTIAPWFTLIGVILGIPTILTAFGLGAWFVPFGWVSDVQLSSYWMAAVFTLVTLILQAMAIPKLFKREKAGWNLAFYVSLVNIVYGVFYENLIGLVLSTLISWYLLFQIREKYKN